MLKINAYGPVNTNAIMVYDNDWCDAMLILMLMVK